MENNIQLSYPIQALVATIFTWGVTALGAGVVFFFKEINKKIMDAMLGFAGGIMLAAAFFSLLAPSIEMSKSLGLIPWVVASVGFIFGGLLLCLGDRAFERIEKKTEGSISLSRKRCLMLFTSITLHNIPEGMAIGVAFGSLAYSLDGATATAAYLLALGIGIQNFPEGAAISIPLLREGFSRRTSFFYGQLSAIVEPVFGFLGVLLVLKVRMILPFMLSFAAGAMIYVVIRELIPESQGNAKKELMTISTLAGFCIMMILDLALG